MSGKPTRVSKGQFRQDRTGTNGSPSSRPSRVTYMAHGKGWVMVRHPGCIPFTLTEKTWLSFPYWTMDGDQDGAA